MEADGVRREWLTVWDLALQMIVVCVSFSECTFLPNIIHLSTTRSYLLSCILSARTDVLIDGRSIDQGSFAFNALIDGLSRGTWEGQAS